MKVPEMIEVLQAYERGEQIEYRNDDRNWEIATHPSWSFKDFDYRIAPKKMTLVEELLAGHANNRWRMGLLKDAADWITDLQNELADCVKRHAACYTLLVDKTPPVSEFDKNLALRMLDLCEYITFHDGRYGQLENQKASDAAYALAKVLVEKLDVKMYADRERTI